METTGVMQAAAGLAIYAGILGAAGVAMAAAGAHGQGLAQLTPAAQFLVMHAAAAFGAIGLATRAAHPNAFLLGTLVILIGVTLFSGDIALRTLWGSRLFPMAAPTGGTTMILGWLMLAVAGAWEVLAHRG